MMAEERDRLMDILTSSRGSKKTEAIVAYLEELTLKGRVTWPKTSAPSVEVLRDQASYMSPILAVLSEEEAREVLQGRTMLYLHELMVGALRTAGGWDAEDRRLGVRMVR